MHTLVRPGRGDTLCSAVSASSIRSAKRLCVGCQARFTAYTIWSTREASSRSRSTSASLSPGRAIVSIPAGA